MFKRVLLLYLGCPYPTDIQMAAVAFLFFGTFSCAIENPLRQATYSYALTRSVVTIVLTTAVISCWFRTLLF